MSSERITTVATALRGPEFTAGIRFGLLALAIGVVVGVVWRRRFGEPAPLGGLLLAGATTAGVAEVLRLPDGLTSGLVAVAAAGILCDVFGLPLWVGAVLAAPGAWLLSTQADVAPITAVRVSVGVATVVGGWLVADFDHCHRHRAWSFPLLAVSAVGVYLTVPDTEQALVLLGVAAALVLLAWPVPLASLGVAGSFAAVAVVAWTVATGGHSRPSSIVGGLGSLGLLVAEPFCRQLFPHRVSPLTRLEAHWWAVVPVCVAQAALVLFASRVAGMRSLAVAVVLVVAELAVANVALLALGSADVGSVADVRPPLATPGVGR